MVEVFTEVIRQLLPVLGAFIVGFAVGIAFVWWVLT